jgi:hypothetical protein
MDVLAIGDYVFDKAQQPPFVEKGDWRAEFKLD